MTLTKEDTPLSEATPTQQRLAREHAERMKRWGNIRPAVSRPQYRPVVVNAKRALPDPIDQWFDAYKPLVPHMLTHRKVQDIVAAEYGLTLRDLVGDRRLKRTVLARQIAMFLCLETIRGASLMAVGRWFRRDHTTVLHARETIGAKLENDPTFATEIEHLRRRIKRAAEPTE